MTFATDRIINDINRRLANTQKDYLIFFSDILV